MRARAFTLALCCGALAEALGPTIATSSSLSARPRTRTAAETRPHLVATLPSLRWLLIDDRVRGKDQRTAWLRALSRLHPRYRLALTVLVAFFVYASWLRPGWTEQCVPLSVGPPSVRTVCRAVVALVSVACLVATVIGALVVGTYRGLHEERKDAALSEEQLAAAAASAAYEGSAVARLAELRARGVDSENWRVDDELSCDTVAVFYNPFDQRILVAFRGTATLSDWASNLRRIVPGDEEHSPSFQHGLRIARAVQDKYVLVPSILLTGHSRGGSMADFAGRKLGLPSTTFNPAVGACVCRMRTHAHAACACVCGKPTAALDDLVVHRPADGILTRRPASRCASALPLHLPHVHAPSRTVCPRVHVDVGQGAAGAGAGGDVGDGANGRPDQ